MVQINTIQGLLLPDNLVEFRNIPEKKHNLKKIKIYIKYT